MKTKHMLVFYLRVCPFSDTFCTICELNQNYFKRSATLLAWVNRYR